jgi:hypothetical protein
LELHEGQINLVSIENGTENKASQLGDLDDFGISMKQSPNTQDLEYDFLCFFLYNPRETLYHFIDQRCEEMVAGELIKKM